MSGYVLERFSRIVSEFGAVLEKNVLYAISSANMVYNAVDSIFSLCISKLISFTVSLHCMNFAVLFVEGLDLYVFFIAF